jgi:hypothetical protein
VPERRLFERFWASFFPVPDVFLLQKIGFVAGAILPVSRLQKRPQNRRSGTLKEMQKKLQDIYCSAGGGEPPLRAFLKTWDLKSA